MPYALLDRLLNPEAPLQVAEEVFTLSRVVRTFGTERAEGERYLRYLTRLARISVRQAAAYFMYLSTASVLYYVTKVRAHPPRRR